MEKSEEIENIIVSMSTKTDAGKKNPFHAQHLWIRYLMICNILKVDDMPGHNLRM